MREHGFGTMPDGREVTLFVLTNAKGSSVSVTDFGGIVTSVVVPDKRGTLGDVVLGFGDLDWYLTDDRYHGSIIGRYGNRIGGGRFTLDDREYSLTRNNGDHHLHGGFVGFNKVLWRAQPPTAAGRLQLTHISPDGDEGYPGELAISVTYTLTDEDELRIDYVAATDQPTVVNLTNHSYFNLAGPGSDTILDHIISINADGFTPVGADLIPTGEIRSVRGTPMDLRKPIPIGALIDGDFDQLRFADGFDHNWVLNRTSLEPTNAAGVFEPTTGRVLEVLTTEPGIQFYTGNFLEGTEVGKAGKPHGRRAGFCLETQHFPDSPNQPDFPSTVLFPDETYRSTTIYRFSTR